MPLRPEDLDALPEPARTKLRRALAQIEAVKGTAPASIAADATHRSTEGKSQKSTSPSPRPVVPWQREGAGAPLPRNPAPRPAPPAADAPRSLFERLRDWLTEEDPPTPPRRFVSVESHGKVHRFAAAAEASAAEPDAVAAEPEPVAAEPEAVPHPTGAPPVASGLVADRGRPRDARPRRRKRQADDAWIERDPWLVPVAVMGIVALVAVGAGAMRHPGTSRPATSAHVAASHSESKAALPSSSVIAPTSTRQPSVPAGQPDCASVATHMQPVPPPQGSTRQAIPGLCYSLGDGRSWEVGCATGFGTTCTHPALEAVLACVRAAGTQQRGVVNEANVETCAVAEAKAPAGGDTSE